EIVAWNSALTSGMIYTQPVVHELERLSMPVLLLIGDKDTTGKSNAVPPQIRATLGNFPVMAKEAAARIAHAKLVELPGLGPVEEQLRPGGVGLALSPVQAEAVAALLKHLQFRRHFRFLQLVEEGQAIGRGRHHIIVG